MILMHPAHSHNDISSYPPLRSSRLRRSSSMNGVLVGREVLHPVRNSELVGGGKRERGRGEPFRDGGSKERRSRRRKGEEI